MRIDSCVDIQKVSGSASENKGTVSLYDSLFGGHPQMVGVGDLTFCPVAEDAIIVQNLLAEPQLENSLEVDTMYTNSDGGVACFEVEDFPCTNDELKFDYGKLVSDYTKFEFCDSIFHEVDAGKSLPFIGEHTVRDPQFLLDAVFLDHGSLQYSIGADDFLENLHSNSNSEPSNVDVDSDAAVISGPSSALISTVESSFENDSMFLDSMSIGELHDVFKHTFGRDTFINNKDWLKRRILSGSQKYGKYNNDSILVDGGSSLNGREDSVYFLPGHDFSRGADGCTSEMQIPYKNADEMKKISKEMITNNILAVPTVERLDISNDDIGVATKKRLRRPTRRYIEESSNIISKRNHTKMLIDKVGCLNSNSNDRLIQARVTTLLHNDDSGVALVIGKEQSVRDHGGLFQCTIRSRRGRPRKKSAFQAIGSKGIEGSGKFNCELIGNMSDSSALKLQKVAVRRKHHRLWSLSEVLKLIEGVSRYGVGRWTEIKRLLFSSYAHRTSVDLKDKWRNLLRATGAHIHGKKEASKKRQMCLPIIPQSVTRRVRELAVMYPYPREKHAKSPPSLNVTSTEMLKEGSTTAAATRRGRTAQRSSSQG